MGWTSSWGLTLTHSAVPHTHGAMPNTDTPTLLAGSQKITSKLASIWTREATKKGKTTTEVSIWKRSFVCVFSHQISRGKKIHFWRAHRGEGATGSYGERNFVANADTEATSLLWDKWVFDHADTDVVAERTVTNRGTALSGDARQSLESEAARLNKESW